MDAHDSLWGLYLKQVIPSQLFHHNRSKVFVQRTGAFRYSLLRGNVTVDDIIAVDPFNNSLWKVSNSVLGADILRALGDLFVTPKGASLPPLAISSQIEPERSYALYTVQFSLAEIVDRFQNTTGLSLYTVPVVRNGKVCRTTELWQSFVVEQWSTCPTSGLKSGVVYVVLAIGEIVAVVVALLVALLVAVTICRLGVIVVFFLAVITYPRRERQTIVHDETKLLPPRNDLDASSSSSYGAV